MSYSMKYSLPSLITRVLTWEIVLLPEDVTILARDIEEGGDFKNKSVESGTRNLPAYVLGYEDWEVNMEAGQPEDVNANGKIEDVEQVEGDGIRDSGLIGDLFTKALMFTSLFQSKVSAAIQDMSYLTEGEKRRAQYYTRESLMGNVEVLPKFCSALKVLSLKVGVEIVNIVRGEKDVPTNTQHDEYVSNIAGYCSKFLGDAKDLKKDKDVSTVKILELETSFCKLISENLLKAYKEYLDNSDDMDAMKLIILELYSKLNQSQKTLRIEKMKLLTNTVDMAKSIAVMSLNVFSSDQIHPTKQLIKDLSEVKKVFEQHEIFGTTAPRCLTQFKYFDVPSGQ